VNKSSSPEENRKSRIQRIEENEEGAEERELTPMAREGDEGPHDEAKKIGSS
jgi:hypothetical protein